MFAYCRNNPIRRKDISGTTDVDIFDDGDSNLLDDEKTYGGGKGSSDSSGNTGGNQKGSKAGSGYDGNNNSKTTNGNGSTPSNTPRPVVSPNAANGKTGIGQAPKQGDPGTVYSQISSDGNVISQTIYGDGRMPAARFDYIGHSHGTIIGPHVHLFYLYHGPKGIFLNNGPILPWSF